MKVFRPSRREALVGAAAVAACRPQKEGESAAPEAATIDTIVVLMLENRSFDHYLGSLRLVEGSTEVDGLEASMSNPDNEGVEHAVTRATVDCVADPGHSWSSSHDQFNGGANDGFVQDYEGRASDPSLIAEVMGYFTREELPITYTLADSYTVCDAWFCSVMGPTWPNRFFAHAGTSDGQDDNSFPSDGAFTFPTVWKKLEEAGVSWHYYYTDVPFLALFADHMSNDTFGFIEDFFDDAAAGKLPSVVWIDPGFTFNDDHPPHHPGLGQEVIAAVYNALAQSPHWDRCLLVVTYDEHGGFFDHVAPPTTEDDNADLGFDQMGFRVPTLLVGPYVRPGVDHTVYDHTSWLKYVCERFGIDPWTARIAAANSIGGALDTDRMANGEAMSPVELPAWDMDEEAVPAECQGVHDGPPPPLVDWVRQRFAHYDRSMKAAEILEAIRRRA